MERVTTYVPPPLKSKIARFESQEGYESEAQAIRALIRRGLDDA